MVSKPTYVQVSTCVRTPFLGSPVALPGVVKAVEFDKGGQGVAYNDSDVANQGALPTPPCPAPTIGGHPEQRWRYRQRGLLGRRRVAEIIGQHCRKAALYRVTARVPMAAVPCAYR